MSPDRPMKTTIDAHHDVDKYVPGGFVACSRCKNYEGGKTCKAFKGGIPQVILDGKDDHKKPYPGDNGIMFEPID